MPRRTQHTYRTSARRRIAFQPTPQLHEFVTRLIRDHAIDPEKTAEAVLAVEALVPVLLTGLELNLNGVMKRPKAMKDELMRFMKKARVLSEAAQELFEGFGRLSEEAEYRLIHTGVEGPRTSLDFNAARDDAASISGPATVLRYEIELATTAALVALSNERRGELRDEAEFEFACRVVETLRPGVSPKFFVRSEPDGGPIYQLLQHLVAEACPDRKSSGAATTRKAVEAVQRAGNITG